MYNIHNYVKIYLSLYPDRRFTCIDWLCTGFRERRRPIEVIASEKGLDCPSVKEVQPCDQSTCSTWQEGQWGPCELGPGLKHCGEGRRSRAVTCRTLYGVRNCMHSNCSQTWLPQAKSSPWHHHKSHLIPPFTMHGSSAVFYVNAKIKLANMWDFGEKCFLCPDNVDYFLS